MKPKFYKCGDSLLFSLSDSATVCSRDGAFEELVPGAADASFEKHVPTVVRDGKSITVNVGEVSHPMTKEHLIEYVVLECMHSFKIRSLNAEETPIARFAIEEEDVPVAVYAVCNLHGVWKREI